MNKKEDMTDEQILTAAIKKANENGWEEVGGYSFATMAALEDYPRDQKSREFILFSHEFAKAFFGEEMCCEDFSGYTDLKKEEITQYLKCKHCGCVHEIDHPEYGKRNWQHYLQQLALSENRLQYLKRFL